MDKREEQFKRMVLAYLHDPPHKVLDLGRHEEFAESFIRTVWIDRPEGSEDLRIEGMTESRDSYPWETTPDHAAAAADRVIFPNRFAKAGGPFDGIIKHPLGAGERKISCGTVGQAEQNLQNSFGGIQAGSWRAFFFLLWRRWREESAAIDPARSGAGGSAGRLAHSGSRDLAAHGFDGGVRGVPEKRRFPFGAGVSAVPAGPGSGVYRRGPVDPGFMERIVSGFVADRSCDQSRD